MKKPFHSLTRRVVVITGASSGIGRAAAVAFARQGARLVLGARRERALRLVAAECERLGARVEIAPTDVTNAEAVERLAEAAIHAFRRIDVWINNAGVGLFGPFAGADLKTHKRVVETNLFGTMHGAAAVLPHFLRQRRGVLINMISLGGFAPTPFASAYTASKFGVRGFVAGLRQELTHVPGIRVCSVFPSFVDTPGFQHGGNVSGAQLRPGRPIYAPDRVANAVVSLALNPRDELPVGWPARLARIGYGVAPELTERAAGAFIRRYLRSAPPARTTQGNLFLPVSAGTAASGGWRHPTEWKMPSAPRLALAGLLALGAAVVLHGNGSFRGTAIPA